MASLKDRLQQILIRDKLISLADLNKALDEQQKSGGELSQILVRLNLIKEDVLTSALSESLGIPRISIARLQVDPNVLKLISKDVATKYQIIPISLIGDHLSLAMADPLNIFTIDSVKTLTGFTINTLIAKPKEISDAIQKYYFEEDDKAVDKIDKIIQDLKDTGEIEVVTTVTDQHQGDKVEELTDEAPIIKLTDTIIHQAVLAKASDVLIEPFENAVRIRYRVDGIIREIDRFSKVLLFPLISRIKVIANLDISEHRLPQDGRFKTIIAGGKEIDFRVSILPTALGEKAVLRVLDKSGVSALDLDTLGFEPEALKRLKENADKPHGMILVCGPTGSGKTTTLYSILKYLDSPGENIVTVEDPVEYQIKGMNQVNVKPAMGLTFAACLRSILRQDPDIIMVGEIRDTETLDIAIKAALTGHLVLSSLHTTTASGSIIRMVNMGVEPFLICSSVLAVVAQRLLRKLCINCREQYKLNQEVAEKIGLTKIFPKQKTFELYRNKGCSKCFNIGYQGRVGITEVMVLTHKMKELILSRAGEIKIKELARAEGMQTMREDALRKAVEGLTSLEEVLRITAADEN